VREDASYINFFSRAGDIDQIIEKYNLFGSWDMAWWNSACSRGARQCSTFARTWQFLQCHALVIAKT